jgi:AcrR family transcriptional regulator
MSRQLSEAKKCLIKDAGLQNMTVREAARYAGVDQRTIIAYFQEYGLKSKGHQTKVKLPYLMKGVIRPGEQLTIENLITRIREEQDLNGIDAKDLQGKLDLLIQFGVYAYDKEGKMYCLPSQPM